MNNSLVKKSYQLKHDDEIQIEDFQRFDSSDIMKESPNIELEIKLEKDDYLVVYKPK
ncbi:MAG: hypothetical protein ACOZBL_05055 [Patescibacteria group bacterium]